MNWFGLEWWLLFLLILGIFSVFTIESRLRLIVQQFVILQRKLDLVLRHLGIEDVPPGGGLSPRVQEIARDPAHKIEAIKVHREETGAGLKEAKEAVEKWRRDNALE